MGWNSTEITKKNKEDHENFKLRTVGWKGDRGWFSKMQCFLFAAAVYVNFFSSFTVKIRLTYIPANIMEIQGPLILTCATKKARKVAQLATKHGSWLTPIGKIVTSRFLPKRCHFISCSSTKILIPGSFCVYNGGNEWHLRKLLSKLKKRERFGPCFLFCRFNRYETKLLEYEGRVCNGSYIWRIENYRQCRQDAINGVMTAIHSPAFYTNLYGYKLCMRINLNGVDSGVGKHVALFVHMMQGDYDTILEWPFTGRIALSIMDQSDGAEYRHHISETLVAKPNLLAFQRPTAPRNYKGYGYVEFAPIEQIREPKYVKNNTMLVRIQIFH